MTDPMQTDSEKTPGTSGMLVQARGLTIGTRPDGSSLSDVSFQIEPGELVAVTGLSRAEKSLLLRSLAGLSKPAEGEILIDGVDLYANLKAFHPAIGYVPGEFALHPELMITEIMQDAALLRLPRRMNSQARKQRLSAVLESVGLTTGMDRRVGSLSNMERRRLSIAVELIGSPGLLLVDESAEPLTPFDDVQITILLREVSRQGVTIVQVNPRSRSAGLSDKLLFLGLGGYLAWFGPSEEAFAYLKGLLPRGVVKDLFGLQEAMEMLVNPEEHVGAEWAKRFRDHLAYQKYVDDPLNNRYPDLMLQTRPLLRLRLRNSSKEKLPPPIVARANGFQKLMLLIRRNTRLLWRDRSAWSMLAIPPLVALVHFGLSSTTSAGFVPPLVFDLFMFLVVVTAGMLVRNEMIKEKPVYQREQRTGSLLLPYIFSKLWLVGLLALYQGLVWTVIHSLRETGTVAGWQALLPSGITFFLIALIGGILGLMISALSRTTITTVGWLLLLTIPQILFIVNPLSHWSRLVLISVFLIVVLVGIQQGTARAKT